MTKAVVSVFILAATIVGAILLYTVVLGEYPTFGTFENLVFLGLVTFGLGLGIFISALILDQEMRESKK